jgi:hypothetical protein
MKVASRHRRQASELLHLRRAIGNAEGLQIRDGIEIIMPTSQSVA